MAAKSALPRLQSGWTGVGASSFERFHRDCGLPPKAIARIVRFNAAQAKATAVERPDWADIAIACGYSDQPHLIREFVAFAGVAPTQWRFPP